MAGPGLQTKKRLLAVLVLFFLVFIYLAGHTGYIQLVQGQTLKNMAYEQQTRGRVITPKRGTIYDRNGKELAISASVDTIVVNPKDISRYEGMGEKIAEKLSEILEMDKETILKKVNRNTWYEIIKAKVDKSVGDQVRQWIKEEDIKGVYVDEDSKRFYPHGNLACHVIGFVGTDNYGLDGIEAVMEKYLKGEPGRILSELDAGGRTMPYTPERRIEAKEGLNVVLTIDETIQYLAEKAIEKAIEDNNVLNGAVAIVMDPRNGDILALVSKPDYDLNNPFAPPVGIEGVDPETWKGYTEEDVKILQETVWRNKAVADTYEPGSTFKAITAAAGLEEGAIQPDTPVNDRPVKVSGWTISCWRPNIHGDETFAESVYNSCNPVFVKVAQSLGIEKFYSYVRAFGFYDKTGIQLPGEAKSIIHDNPKEIDMAVASFGQRFQITPIQLITAYCAIANGGYLMKPRLVKELRDSQGNIVKTFEPEVIRQVISRETSGTLRQILEGVVSEGTGRNAYVKGYRVAGKTGTSETTDTKQTGRYIASFSAFAPADNPVINVLVILDHPTGDSHTGGLIAAPVAQGLIEDILNYLGVEKRYTEKDKEAIKVPVSVPEVRNLKLSEAKALLNEQGLEYMVEGDGNNKDIVVVDQMPKPGAVIPKDSVVILYTYKPESEETVKVPNLLNKTVYEATKALNSIGLNINVIGDGIVVKQYIDPGTEVVKGTVIDVEFIHTDNVE
ncbi:MAG TPA: PASTA domain-containing protein [Clostridiaceae bacterium]|nr:PASTA domain-containing protein [Clostridiaceae bacterium]